ncbi:MAG: hypothetical protein JHD16_00900 [Solirubrobacteraceae bacterium]|nr:hypothetical protein [Solirubrobacteraceae bacterium]
MSKEIHYLGPSGTFSEQAAIALAPHAVTVAETNHRAVLEAVDADTTRLGVVAIENSRAGLVPGSLNGLIHDTAHSVIRAEHVLPVRFALMRRAGDDSPLRGITAHSMALEQCSEYLAVSGLEKRAADSNAAACAQVGAGELPGWAALGPAHAAGRYGLVVAEESVGDDPDAVTRFVLLSHTCQPPSGRDRTALAVWPSVTEVGSFVRMIQEFNLRGMNMKSIKSIPSRGLLGTDLFFVECPGHIYDDTVRGAIRATLGQGVRVRFLGSFPEDERRDAAAKLGATVDDPPELEAMLARIDG